MADTDPPEQATTLRKQSGAVVSDVRASVLHAARHLEALAELFHLELKEYGRRQTRRLIAMLVGGVLLMCAYMLLCILAVAILQPLVGHLWAFVAVLLFNLVVGMIAMLIGLKSKPAAIAPATTQELKDDIQCIKLYLKGKEKS